jgi:diacylglycerol kinase family enzyme
VPILLNPLAGKRPRGKLVEELAAELRRRQLEPLLCPDRELLGTLAAERAGELRCVVAAGGDGTVAEALNRAAGLPLAVLPLGNENLVARHVGIQRDARQLAELIAQGRCRQFDLARAGERVFSLMASAGFDAEVVRRVHHRRQSHINRLTYLAAILRALPAYRFPPIDVEICETGERLQGAMVLVFNLPEYAFRLPIAPGARADDGWLELLVFQRGGIWSLARHLAAVWRKRQAGLADFQQRRVKKVRLSSAEYVPVQIDGDPGPDMPLLLEVLPAALTLVVPPGG